MRRWGIPVVLIALGLTLLGSAAHSSVAMASCPPSPRGFSPGGTAPERFTMLIRVNKVQNARTYASRDAAAGGLANRIRPQDVFVINTRFPGSTPADWSEIARVLRASFPCNRIASLNGLGVDPAAPGYAYALSDDPRVWALLTDWERLDWAAARFSNPYLATWSGRFPRVLKRARRWIGRLTGAAPRAGLVPTLHRKWQYGVLARNVSGPYRRIAPGRRALQSVQTQAVCAGAGGRGMKVTVGGLLHQYKRANFKRIRVGRSRGARFRYRRKKWKIHPTNLGIEVSFTSRPEPWSSMALLRTSPQRASKCTRAALKRGAGAVLYWASPDSMRALLSIPRMCGLRPSPTC